MRRARRLLSFLSKNSSVSFSCSGFVSPEELVDLEIEPELSVRIPHPPGDCRGDGRPVSVEDRRDENGVALVEAVPGDEVHGEVEIAPVGHDEFHFVSRPKPGEVRKVVRVGHPGAGALHVEDLHDAGIDPLRRDMSPRLDEDGVAAVAEGRREREEPLLRQRFAAGDLHEGHCEGGDLREDVPDGHGRPAGECIGRVAPDAPEGTPREPDEGAGEPGEGRLPLKAPEDLRHHDDGIRAWLGHAKRVRRSADNGSVRIRLDLAYLGTFFEGWQLQGERPGGEPVRTVQGVLEISLKEIFQTEIRAHGAGRTDSGVHADAQVAHFDLPEGAPLLPSRKIPRALNSRLPWDVRVLSASEVSSDFHARHSAAGKVYVYRLRKGDTLPPHAGLVEALAREPLDAGAMREAARRLVGRRDFAPFSIMGGGPGTTVRTLAQLDVAEEGDVLVVTAVGEGFLRGMMRRLVGTLREAGRGKIAPIEAPDRPGPTAEARGLTLVRVLYPPEELPGRPAMPG